MKVKLLKDIRLQGAPTIQFLAGSICDVSENTAMQWISGKIAEPIRANTETAMLNSGETAVTDKKEIIREQTRKRVQRYREKKNSVTNNEV